ncbi:MAG: hypothetical protein RI885_674 [Actinomycetota bacterium]|jgi:membrane protease YdiL (CAAX protease family)
MTTTKTAPAPPASDYRLARLDDSVTARSVVLVLVAAVAAVLVYMSILNFISRRTEIVPSFIRSTLPLLGETVGPAVAFLVVDLCLVGLFLALLLIPLAILGRVRLVASIFTVRWVWSTVLSCLLVWVLLQIVGVAVAVASGSFGVNATWLEMGPLIGPIQSGLDTIMANSFPEETVSRAIVLGLAFELFRRRLRMGGALAGAFGLSLVTFAVGHIPIAIFDGRDILGTMLASVPAGITYGLLFVITRNIYLLIVVHGIGNATIAERFWIADGVAIPEMITYLVLLVVGLVAALPLLIARRRDQRRADLDGADLHGADVDGARPDHRPA